MGSNTKSPYYPNSYETFDIMNGRLKTAIGRLRGEISRQDAEISRQDAIQRISKIDTTGAYNKVLKNALDNFMKFIDDYDKEKFNPQAINNVSIALNKATKNYDNVQNYNRRQNVYSDETIAIDLDDPLAGMTRVR